MPWSLTRTTTIQAVSHHDILTFMLHVAAEQIYKTMNDQHKWIVTYKTCSNAILHFFGLGLIGAKQSVPKHKHTSKIPVNVYRVTSMMYKMGRWGINDPFKGAKLSYGLGMHQELVQEI